MIPPFDEALGDLLACYQSNPIEDLIEVMERALKKMRAQDQIWNEAIEAAAKAIEKYGLDRVNGMKDYPAAVASACIYHVRELRR